MVFFPSSERWLLRLLCECAGECTGECAGEDDTDEGEDSSWPFSLRVFWGSVWSVIWVLLLEVVWVSVWGLFWEVSSTVWDAFITFSEEWRIWPTSTGSKGVDCKEFSTACVSVSSVSTIPSVSSLDDLVSCDSHVIDVWLCTYIKRLLNSSDG